jgi:rubrerythrin
MSIDYLGLLKRKLADGDGLDWGERAVLIDKLSVIERLRQENIARGDKLVRAAETIHRLRQRVEELEAANGDPHDWGLDSYRCVRCGTTRDDAPDQPCRGLV